MNKYLFHGKLTAKQGQRDELVDILINASEVVETVKGCKLYLVALDDNDLDSVFVTEIWDSKEDHDNSLKIKGVKELIMKAMPILEGQPVKGQEFQIVGGTGV
jgi:quinol monooxygenase YgiN